MVADKEVKGTTAQQTIDFLTQNPSFFNDHSELLLELSLPHKNGNVISLWQKQLEVIRSEFDALKKDTVNTEQQLATLINIVDKNEKLSICLHRLSLRLFFKREVEAAVCEAVNTLRAQFPANQIIIRLFPPYAELSQTASPVNAEDRLLKTLIASLFDSGNPDCGPFSEMIKKALFGNFSKRIRSAVVMPLSFNTQKIGLLLLGSPRADAFVPGKGVMLLVQFGELIAVSIAACAQYQKDLWILPKPAKSSSQH
ncbi:MAG: DUF484 family protein [Chromatiales bacterium]|nr:DUF484 family protein [Chromatiales bacterium]